MRTIEIIVDAGAGRLHVELDRVPTKADLRPLTKIAGVTGVAWHGVRMDITYVLPNTPNDARKSVDVVAEVAMTLASILEISAVNLVFLNETNHGTDVVLPELVDKTLSLFAPEDYPWDHC